LFLLSKHLEKPTGQSSMEQDTELRQTKHKSKQIILSSSRTGWPVRYIHFTDGNGYFSFDVDFFFPLSPTRPLPDLIILVTLQVSYNRKELLTLQEHYGKPSWLYDTYFIYLLTDAIFFRETANAMTTTRKSVIIEHSPLMVG
jgi:hypothetical protein